MSDLRRISPMGMLMAVLLLASCQNSTASPTATVISNSPTATAALPTATLMPDTPTVTIEEEPILTTLPTAVVVLPTATLMPTTPPAANEEEPIPTTLSQVPRIKPQELKAKLDAGEDVIVVDARSRESYERRHIPGTLSIPLSEIEKRHGELPQEGEIVFYCT